MRIQIYIMVLFFTVFSCKNENNIVKINEDTLVKTSSSIEKKTKQKQDQRVFNQFTIELDIEIENGDFFHLYYITESDKKFDEAKSKWLKVKGANHIQKIAFILPEDQKPISFRLDLGKDLKANSFTINSILFGYKSKKIVLERDEYLDYFTPNGCVKINKDGFVEVSEVESNGKTVFVPILQPKTLLQTDIENYIY